MPRVTITLSDKPPQPYRLPLDADAITIGRGGDNDIHIASESVSVHHAKMHRVPGGFELRDLGSTNGLKYEGQKKIFVPLHSGMTVRIGEADFHFELSSAEQIELRAEAPAAGKNLERVETKPVDEPKRKNKSHSGEEMDTPDPDSEFAVEEEARHSGFSASAIVLLLIIVLIAFVVGLAVRHQKETGKSLLHSVMSRSSSEKSPATKAKSAEPAKEAPEAAESSESAAEPTAEPVQEAKEEEKEEADDGFGFAD